jgi:ribosomal protein L40E
VTVCAACGAHNAEDARWCTQCYGGLGPQADPPAASAPVQAARPPAPATDAGAPPGPDTGIRRGVDGLEWACVTCEATNPIEASVCRACATPFTARFAIAERGPAVDWRAARTAGAILPGLGHIRAGAGTSGVARLVLWGVWLLGGLVVLIGDGAAGLPVAGPLLVGAAIVHATSVADLTALERGGRELLAGRALLWLVVGVTVLVIVGLVAGLTGALPSSGVSPAGG